MGRSATNSLAFLQVSMVKTVNAWNKRSLQKNDLKKIFYKVMTRNVSSVTHKTCDRLKECIRLFDRGKGWRII